MYLEPGFSTLVERLTGQRVTASLEYEACGADDEIVIASRIRYELIIYIERNVGNGQGLRA